MTRLHHVLPRADWARIEAASAAYAPASLATEGFIHLCTRAQLAGVLERYFAGQRDLVVLTIDPARVGARIVYETVGADAFPHLYGPLPYAAVIAVESLP